MNMGERTEDRGKVIRLKWWKWKESRGRLSENGWERSKSQREMVSPTFQIPWGSLIVSMCPCVHLHIAQWREKVSILHFVPLFFLRWTMSSGQSTKTVIPEASITNVQSLICLAINIHLIELYYFLLYTSWTIIMVHCLTFFYQSRNRLELKKMGPFTLWKLLLACRRSEWDPENIITSDLLQRSNICLHLLLAL